MAKAKVSCKNEIEDILDKLVRYNKKLGKNDDPIEIKMALNYIVDIFDKIDKEN